MSADWQVGDLAVKVAGPCTIIPKGTIARVIGVEIVGKELALHLSGWTPEEPYIGFYAPNFRKIRPDQHEPCEEEFVTLLRKSKRKVSA